MSPSRLLVCTKRTHVWQGRARQKTAPRDRPHCTTENSLRNTNSFPREFHYVYVIDYITHDMSHVNCPEIVFRYVVVLVQQYWRVLGRRFPNPAKQATHRHVSELPQAAVAERSWSLRNPFPNMHLRIRERESDGQARGGGSLPAKQTTCDANARW